jgi:hypothetical protein
MDLRLALVASSYDHDTRSWTINLQGPDAEILSGGRVENPFTLEEESDLTWFLHKFAIKDPYAHKRAAAVARSLARYRIKLAHCLESHLLLALSKCKLDGSPRAIVLGVHEPNTDVPSLQSLHWELLEDQESWKTLTMPVLFARMISTPFCVFPGTVNPLSPSNSRAVTNILVVSARPGGRDDHPYRLISQPLWDLVHSDPELASRINIHFVRPGTWSAFKDKLLAKGAEVGSFSIVHFDTHGIVDKHGRYGRALKHFLE